jgi:hypothetical protein
MSRRGCGATCGSMNRHCRVPGCSSPAASSFAAYCSPHRSNLRRHGAVDQKAISKTHLKPYLKAVRERISKNLDSPVWVTLDARWMALVDRARDVLAQFSRGKAMSRFEIIAAQEIAKLAATVKSREVVEVSCAVVMMRELEPHWFRSDDAFKVQIVRHVRGITKGNYVGGMGNPQGMVRRIYRELTPRANAILGRWLAETVGVGGQHMARMQQAESEKAAKAAQELQEALSKLK